MNENELELLEINYCNPIHKKWYGSHKIKTESLIIRVPERYKRMAFFGGADHTFQAKIDAWQIRKSLDAFFS